MTLWLFKNWPCTNRLLCELNGPVQNLSSQQTIQPWTGLFANCPVNILNVTVMITFFVDPFDGERLLGVELANVPHLRAQTVVTDVHAQIRYQHVTKQIAQHKHLYSLSDEPQKTLYARQCHHNDLIHTCLWNCWFHEMGKHKVDRHPFNCPTEGERLSWPRHCSKCAVVYCSGHPEKQLTVSIEKDYRKTANLYPKKTPLPASMDLKTTTATILLYFSHFLYLCSLFCIFTYTSMHLVAKNFIGNSKPTFPATGQKHTSISIHWT